jgi:peptidoglycan/LPS O-acetylase OafA/YrhL
VTTAGAAPAGTARAAAAYAPAYRTLDAWRALAAVAVVAFHESQGVLALHPEAVWPGWLYTGASYGWLGVEVFFVVSGYCIAAAAASSARRGNGVGAYLWARARRIYPPYWAASALLIVLTLLLRAGATHGWLPQEVLRSPLVGTTVSGGPAFWIGNVGLLQAALRQGFVYSLSWTLCYEVAFYGIVGLALWAAGRRGGARGVLALLNASTVAVAALVAGTRGAVGYPLDLWPLFGCGVALFTLLTTAPADSRSGRDRLLAGMAVAASLGAFGLLAGPLGVAEIGVARQATAPVFWGLAAVVALLYALRRWDDRLADAPVVRQVVWVGTFSYSLYLTHFIGLSLVRGVASLARIPDEWDIVKLVLSVVASAAIAYGFFLVAERPFLSARHRRAVAEEAAAAAGRPA